MEVAGFNTKLLNAVKSIWNSKNNSEETNGAVG